MASQTTFTPSQRSFLEELLCATPESVLALVEDPGRGGGGGEGCNDDGEEGSPCDLPAIDGTNMADTLAGAGGSQHYRGLNGDDTLSGGGGRDCLEGGNGKDLLDGGPGRDFLFGGNGDDELRGGMGRDDLFGENGHDLLIGGCGPDLMNGGRGDDVLFGGNAPDTYIGGQGRDVFVLALPGGEGGHGGSGSHENPIAPLVHEGGGHEVEEGDVVTDFHQGVDQLALAGGLTYGDLSFQGNAIYVAMEHEAGAFLPLAHEGPGRLLATLTGFATTRLTQDDFLTWADLSLI